MQAGSRTRTAALTARKPTAAAAVPPKKPSVSGHTAPAASAANSQRTRAPGGAARALRPPASSSVSAAAAPPLQGHAGGALLKRRARMPESLNVTNLLERSVGLGNVEEVVRMLRLDREGGAGQPALAACTDALLPMSVFREGQAWDVITSLLLRHPTTSRACVVGVVRSVLGTASSVARMLHVCRECFACFPGLGFELAQEDLVPAFQSIGEVRKRELFQRPCGLHLATLLLFHGAPLPACAYFPRPRVVAEEDLVEDPDFPPSQEVRLQMAYAAARRHLNHRIVCLLFYVRQVRPERLDCCSDSLVEVAGFIPYGHPSLYPRQNGGGRGQRRWTRSS